MQQYREAENDNIILQGTLDFMKALCTEGGDSPSQAIHKLLEQTIAVSMACIPCQHRSVALAALSCMTSLLGKPTHASCVQVSVFWSVKSGFRGVQCLVKSMLHGCRIHSQHIS